MIRQEPPDLGSDCSSGVFLLGEFTKRNDAIGIDREKRDVDLFSDSSIVSRNDKGREIVCNQHCRYFSQVQDGGITLLSLALEMKEITNASLSEVLFQLEREFSRMNW